MLYIGLYISLWERYDVSRIFILFYTNHCSVQYLLVAQQWNVFFLFLFFFFLFYIKIYTRFSCVRLYTHCTVVLCPLKPRLHFFFFFFTSCAWKELTLCLENAHKCVKYSCVTQRLFYNHTAAFAVHIFSLYSVLCLTFYFTEASESCVVIE